MKKQVLLFLTLLFILFSTFLFAQDNRDLATSDVTVDAATWTPGAHTWTFTVTNDSPDAENITSILVEFPSGVNVTGSSNMDSTPPSGTPHITNGLTGSTGITINWTGGNLSAGVVFTGTVNVIIPPGYPFNDIVLNTTIIGDVGGNIDDTITITAPEPLPVISDIRVDIQSGTEGTGGKVKIGSVLLIEADVTGETEPVNPVRALLSTFGGPLELALSSSRDGTYSGSYTVTSGTIGNGIGTVIVRAYNNWTYAQQTDDESFTVDNQAPTFAVNSSWLTISNDLPGLGIANVGDELEIDVSGATVTGGDDESWNIFWTADVDAGYEIPSPAEVLTGNILPGSQDGASVSFELRVYDDAGNSHQETLTSAFSFDNERPDVSDWGSFIVTDHTTETNGIADLNYEAADDITYTTGTEASGDGIIWSINVNGELNTNLLSPGTLTGTVVAGTYEGEDWNPTIIATDNAGNTLSGNSSNLVALNNVIPQFAPGSWTLTVNPGSRAIQYANIGDVIRAEIDITGMDVASGTFDFSIINPAYSAVAGVIAGNTIYADYTVQAGDPDLLVGPGVVVIATLYDTASNVYSAPLLPAPGDQVYVDASAPILGSDLMDTGYLRFSPESAVVAPYTDTPDELAMQLDLPDWGLIGGADKFFIRIEAEDVREEIEIKEYSIDLGNVEWEEGEPVRALLSFAWDGINPGTGHSYPDGNYGLTLWSVSDGAGNEAVQGYDPNNANLPLGITKLNSIHCVIDNAAPIYLDELSVRDNADGTVRTTITRYIEDVNDNDIYDGGDSVLPGDYSAYFQFGVTRQFTQDTQVARREHLDYWFTMESPELPGTVYFWEGTGASGTTSFNQAADPVAIGFSTPNDVNAWVGTGEEITWTPLLPTAWPAGDYTVTAYVQDNAGNIAVSTGRSVVTIEDVFYHQPVLTNIEITSQHDDGLDAFDLGGNHNFYVDSYYTANPAEQYYDTDDEITVEITFDDVEYLDHVEILDESGFGFGTMSFLPTDPEFSGNVLTYTYDVSDIDQSFASLAGEAYSIKDGVITDGFRVVAYDSFQASAIAATNVEDIFNLIVPAEPIWPDESNFTVDTTLPRFSPGWYSHVYDAVSNPARDGNMDSNIINLEMDFPNGLTHDITWYLAVAEEPITSPSRIDYSSAEFVRSGNISASVVAVNQTENFNFYGLKDDPTLAPFIAALETGSLHVSVFATVNGNFTDTGYIVTPPGYTETLTTHKFWVDNTNPEILTEDGLPLIDWNGDANYAGHLYDHELSVSSVPFPDANTLVINFQTSEPVQPGNIQGFVCDIEGNTLPYVPTINVTATGPQVTELDVTGFKEFEVVFMGYGVIPAEIEFLNAVAGVRIVNDAAGNPARFNNPPYPYDNIPPYHVGSDAFRWDSSEAYARFMVLNGTPEIEYATFDHENSLSFVTGEGELLSQGYASEDGTFDFAVYIRDLYYDDIDVAPLRDISSIVSVDFSAFGAEAYETSVTSITEVRDRTWKVYWEDVPFDISALSDAQTLIIPVQFDLHFTDPDNIPPHEYVRNIEVPVITDFTNPVVSIGTPYNESTRESVLEGATYDVDVTVTDNGSGVNEYTTTLESDDPEIIITGGPGTYPSPSGFEEDFNLFPNPNWNVVGPWNPTFWSVTGDAVVLNAPDNGELITTEFHNAEDNILSFWLSPNNFAQNPGDFAIEVSNDSGANWTQIFYQDMSLYHYQAAYNKYTVSLADYNEQDIMVAIRVTNNQRGVILDNFYVGREPWVSRESEVVTFNVEIPEDHDNRTFTLTAEAEDNVANLGTDTKDWDVTNVPMVEVADLDNLNPLAPNFVKNGDDVALYINVRDVERISEVQISLNTDFVYPVARTTYAPEEILTLTKAEYLALPWAGPARVNPSWEFRVIELGSLNLSETLVDCDDVIATVTITHEYSDVSNSDSSTDTSEIDWLVVDNAIPTIENIAYAITPTGAGNFASGSITITAEVSDNPVACPAGLNNPTILLDLTGVNGEADVAYDAFTGGVATWNLTWPGDFAEDPWAVASALGSINGNISVTASDNLGNEHTEGIQIDTMPTIDDVKWYVNGNETDVILPDTQVETYVDVYVTATENHLSFEWADRIYMSGTGFDFGTPTITPVRDTEQYIFRFYPDFDFTADMPEIGYFTAEFNTFAISMYNYRSDDMENQVIVTDYPREDLFGTVDERAQAEYDGNDPSGWFAPEHNIRGEMTFYTVIPYTTDDVIANFDYVGDFVNPWINPDEVATVTSESITLNGGTPFEVTFTLLTQTAVWNEIVTDAQSIWNLIIPTGFGYPDTGNVQDGYNLPIEMKANFFGFLMNLPTKYIRVDLNDPAYSNADGSQYYLDEPAREALIQQDRFDIDVKWFQDVPETRVLSLVDYNYGDSGWDAEDRIFTVEIPYAELPFTQDLVITTFASDYISTSEYPSVGGVSPLNIAAPTSDGFAITPYAADEFGYLPLPLSPNPDDEIYYANWVLTPPAGGYQHGDAVTVQLGTITDMVGHNGGATPSITFEFVGQYQNLNTDDLVIYKYIEGEPENDATAPYVQAGGKFGIKLPVVPLDRDTSISGVDVQTAMLENEVADTAEADALPGSWWKNLTENATDGVWYLDQLLSSYVVNPNYADGTELYVKLRVNYVNGSVQETGWVTARTENFAIVDDVDPEIVEYGIEIWSETLGYSEEGYVVPGDNNATLKVTFEDNIMMYPEGATPVLSIEGLDQFIDSYWTGGFQYAMPSPFIIPGEYVTAQRGTWVAEIPNLEVNPVNPVATQKEISVSLWDAVGNAFAGNPATKFVEITADGPIVPVIKGMEVIAGDPAETDVDYTAFVPNADMAFDASGNEFFIAEGEDAPIYINVYVRAKYKAYIEEMWLNLENLGGAQVTTIVPADITQVPGYSNLWKGTYVMPNPQLNRATDVTITSNTLRHPFGAFDVFTDEFEVTLHVDELDVVNSALTVANNLAGFEVEWTFDPDNGFTVVAEFDNIRGELGNGINGNWDIDLADIADWFYLANDGTDVLFNTTTPIYPDEVEFIGVDDVITPNYAHRDFARATWVIPAGMLDPYWADNLQYGAEDTAVNFDVHFRNIYAEWLIRNTSEENAAGILVDDQNPVFIDAYTYGENHQPNQTIVPSDDSNVLVHLEYTDVNGVKYVTSNWSDFGGATDLQMDIPTRAEEDFIIAYGSDVYNIYPEISMNGDVYITLTDNVGNTTSLPGDAVNTTFVFEENDTFSAYVYPNASMVNSGGDWYMKDPAMQLFIEHDIMQHGAIQGDAPDPLQFEGIDNDGDFDTDEPGEGLVFTTPPLEIDVNSHVDNNWFAFPHDLTVDGETNLIELQGQFEELTEGAYTIHVNTDNIFGHHLQTTVDFFVDQTAPRVAEIRFQNVGGGLTQSYDMNDVIISYTDWEAVQITFEDILLADARNGGQPGVGIDTAASSVSLSGPEGEITEFEVLGWNGNTLTYGIETSRWSGLNLPAGDYTLTMIATDLLGNTETYTKSFFYNYTPAEITMHIFDNNHVELGGGDVIELSDEVAYIGATVNDEFGMVTSVNFQLFFDVNNDNNLDAGDAEYMHIAGTPDTEVPFESTWNLLNDTMTGAELVEHMNVYNYRHDENDFNTDTRDWFIVTTVTSNSGQVAEETTTVMVKDNVGPAPLILPIETDRAMVYNPELDEYTFTHDFDNMYSNTAALAAWCKYNDDEIRDLNNIYANIDGSDPDWPDAWYVNYIITGPNNYEEIIGNSYMQPASHTYNSVWNWGELAIDNPGQYFITAMGYDRVGNSAEALNTIVVNLNTVGTAWSELAMVNFDVPNWDLVTPIINGSEFGPLDPIQNIHNLRLDATIHEMDEVVSLGFYYDVTNNVTGEVVSTMNPLLNDPVINPDFGTDLTNILPQEVDINSNVGTLRVVVDEEQYRGTGYDSNDYSYSFYIMITDYSGVPFIHGDSDVVGFRVDYVAPAAYMMPIDEVLTGMVDDVTVAVPALGNAADEFADTYNLAGLDHALNFKWSYDGVTWNLFEPLANHGTATVETLGTEEHTYSFNDWNTYLLDALDVTNYEGNVWVTTEVQDIRGNWADAAPTQLYIDNQAPEVPITQISYRGTVENDGIEPSLYQDWHEVGTMPNELNQTITVAYNQLDTPEDGYLRLRAHQTDILDLSVVGLEPGMANDLDTPVMLFHGTGDDVNVLSSNDVIATDHEVDGDGYFFFDILLDDSFDPAQVHYFAFMGRDIRGNLEADTDHNGNIDVAEFDAAWDLRVNLVNDVPIMTQVINPDNPFAGEWINLAAIEVESQYPTNEMLNSVTFQISGDTHNWTDLGTVVPETDGDAPYFFHLYRNEIPMFDDMPFVPGVHVFDDGYEIGELVWNGTDAWIGTIEMTLGEHPAVTFVPDMNDNGTIETGEMSYEFAHPNNWGTIRVAPAMLAFNSVETRLADGIYYVRAVPNEDPRGAELFGLVIDNTAPAAAIDIVGNDDAMPEFQVGAEVPMVTDIDGLLVVEDDLYNVVYQYSAQAEGAEFRKWFYFAETTDLPGDFAATFVTPNPLTDDIDNDGDGHVDEVDEANATYYVRSYAYDRAGNYGYSNEQAMIVDGSVARMHVSAIDGVAISGETAIVNIPESGMLELTASDITPEYLDGAVEADFYFADTDLNYTLINMDGPVPVVDGIATVMWNLDMATRELLAEGYYALIVLAADRVGNVEDMYDAVPVPIILNDVTGPEAYITSVGGRPMVGGNMFFANEGNYNGIITVAYTNPADVATITVEYSIDGTTWHNIDTVDMGRDAEEISWILPSELDDTYFLRAYVEDHQANDTENVVTFYYDNVDPALAAEPVLANVLTLNGQPVLDVRGGDITTDVTYLVDDNHGLFDVADVDVQLMPIGARADYELGTNSYAVPGTESDNFAADLSAAVSDEYEVVVTVTDFAGNTAMYNYGYYVIDQTAPTFNANDLVHVTTGHQMDWYAVSDGSAIEFTFAAADYADAGVQDGNNNFLGVETAVLTLTGDVAETVTGTFDVDGNISFVWTPAALAAYTNEAIAMSLTLTDYYNNTTTNSTDAMFMLLDTEASIARILEVDDNPVDWQNEEAADVMASGNNAMIDAYVPVSMDPAQLVRFEWNNEGTWEELATVASAATGVTPPYEYPTSDMFSTNWDISELANGTYQVRAIAIDYAGQEDGEPMLVNVTINNNMDYPMAQVWYGDAAATELVRGQMYNLTATSAHPEMITNIDWYYRYSDETGEFTNDEWFFIGADADTEHPYFLNNWLISNLMIPGINIQIVAVPTYVADVVGDPVDALGMYDMGYFVELGIVDTTAPVIESLEFYSAQREGTLIDMWINNDILGMIDYIRSDISAEYPEEDMNDLHRIVLSYSDPERSEQILEEIQFNNEASDNPHEYIYTNNDEGWDISDFVNGEYEIKLTVWDTADNMSELALPFYIDTVAPATALTITDMDGQEVEYLQRDVTYLLNANATDNMMVAGYAYTYTYNGDVIAITGDADQVEFTVPSDIEYGAELVFEVTATDMVGLNHSSTVAKLVYDPATTEIIITQVAGTPYVPELHINGEAVNLVASVLGNQNPDYITQVAFMYRYVGSTDWMLLNADAPVVAVDNGTTEDNWDVSELAEGMVEVGVVPVTDPNNIFETPLYFATLEIDHTAPVMGVPVVVIPAFINGSELRVEFAELPADLNHAAVRFEYAVADQAGIPEAWTTIDVAPDFYSNNGNFAFVLEDVELDNNQVYDFRLTTADVSIPTPNTGVVNNIEEIDAGTLYDTAAPAVFISEIDGNLAPFAEPVEITLATEVTFTADAFEHAEEYPMVSGINYVEFYVENGDEEEFMIGMAEAAPYTIMANTMGLEIGNYDVWAVAYDNAGNETESESVTVRVVSNIDPIAYIAGFDFDEENPNVDYIYAVTKDCVDAPSSQVVFEYTNNGVDWTQFATAEDVEIVNGVELWMAPFNANAMNVLQLRAMVIKPNGEFTDRFATLDVTYSDAMGGMFEFDTNEDVVIYNEDVVDVMNAEAKPFLLGMNEVMNNGQASSVQLLDPIQMNDNTDHYTAPIVIDGIDTTYGNMITVWTSYEANGVVILEKAELRVYPVTVATGTNGVITSEDDMMTLNIPMNSGTGYVYFEPVHANNMIPRNAEYEAITGQEALLGHIEYPGTAEFTMALTGDYNENGEIFAMFHNGSEWEMIPAALMDGVAMFSAAPAMGVYTIVQAVDMGLNVDFVEVSNEWMNGDVLWTQFGNYSTDRNGTGVEFTFRTFTNQDGDNYEVDTDVMIDVYLDGTKVVDANTADNDMVAADLVIDEVSGLFYVQLNNQEYLSDEMMHSIRAHVYMAGYSAEVVQDFYVDITSPEVMTNGGGYVRHGMSISATITDPETGIFEESMALRLFNPEDQDNTDEQLVINYGSMDIMEVENGYEVSYELTLDDLNTVMLDTADMNELYAVWTGWNNVNIHTADDENVVVYVIDVAAPVVWAVSPVGAPIDNDGDGLFNEDPINGINEDLDFDDWNNNNVQDGMWVTDSTGTHWVGEPSLIDEDPIDFEPDTLMYDQDVVIAVAYEDIPRPTLVDDCDYCGMIYSGACGVDEENIVVTLNGEVLPNDAATITAGSWQIANDDIPGLDENGNLTPGHYVVIASIPDMIGNVGTVNYEFEVISPAPTVEFLAFEDAGWWFTQAYGEAVNFMFKVNATAGIDLAEDGVVASFYSVPSETLVQGPMTLTSTVDPELGEIYIASLGVVLPETETGVRLEVVATNVLGGASTSNQTYSVDNQAPAITFVTPQDGQIFGINDNVQISATYEDVMGGVVLSRNSRSKAGAREIGSGINETSAYMVITEPDGTVSEPISGGLSSIDYTIASGDLMIGTYMAKVTVRDNVGNEAVASVQFVVESSAPSVEFYALEGYNGADVWAFNPLNNNGPFTFDVNCSVPLAEDGVVVAFYVGDQLIQGPQTLTEVDGIYSVNLGTSVGNDAAGVRLEVTATNTYGEESVSSQTYGIDATAPVVTFESPLMNAAFNLNEAINILVTYTDNVVEPRAGFAAERTFNTSVLKGMKATEGREMGAGIAHAEMVIYDPSGTAMETVTGNAQSMNKIFMPEEIGTYHVIATVTDMVGNQTVESIEFSVNADALTISFLPFTNSGWYWGPNSGEEFMFTVSGEVAANGVSINFYTVDGNLLQGPQTVNGTEGTYAVNLAYVPEEVTAVTLEVTATNVSGIATVSSKTYQIDSVDPVVTIIKPEAGAMIEDTDDTIIEILADLMDEGSGIASAVVKLDDNVIESALSGDKTSVSAAVDSLSVGAHKVEIIVTDNTANVTSATVEFAIGKPDGEIITEAHVYPNPGTAGEGVTFSIDFARDAEIEVEIFDWAGNKVRTLRGTDTRNEITWKGKTDSGVNVARGVYFARVKANDGRKVEEKIVKIAIKK